MVNVNVTKCVVFFGADDDGVLAAAGAGVAVTARVVVAALAAESVDLRQQPAQSARPATLLQAFGVWDAHRDWSFSTQA